MQKLLVKQKPATLGQAKDANMDSQTQSKQLNSEMKKKMQLGPA